MKQYTIQEIAKLADVSVRTLHYYDQIGLLKAARFQNGYRQYADNELLKLQQILFYKELDFSLEQIKTILEDPTFDVISALKHHKLMLRNRVLRFKILMNTIDKTILHINESTMITDEDLYAGFSKDQKERYDKEARATWGDKKVDASIKTVKKLTKAEFKKMQMLGESIGTDLAKLMDSNKPESKEVQEVVAKHFAWVNNFWEPNEESYSGLGKMYVDHPEFKAYYEKHKPGLAEFLRDGIHYYAKTVLKNRQ